jgi:hypothetical protein
MTDHSPTLAVACAMAAGLPPVDRWRCEPLAACSWPSEATKSRYGRTL